VRLLGFGFVQAGDDLSTKFSTADRGDLQCSGGSCIQQATYVDKNTIETPTYPQAAVAFKDNGESISTHAMVIEASVTGRNEGFTENGLQIWYYETPEVINLNVNGAPINQQKHVLIKTDFKWATNDVSKIKQYGNFTCRFSSKDGKRIAYTKAKMETYPIGSLDENLKPTHVRC
jgi:hypothetical protein